MIDQLQEFFEGTIGTSLLGLLVALLVLIVGYIIARIVAGVIRRLLKRTELDNRLADALSEPEDRRDYNVEDTIARIVFWVLMLFVLAAFFQLVAAHAFDGANERLPVFPGTPVRIPHLVVHARNRVVRDTDAARFQMLPLVCRHGFSRHI